MERNDYMFPRMAEDRIKKLQDQAAQQRLEEMAKAAQQQPQSKTRVFTLFFSGVSRLLGLAGK